MKKMISRMLTYSVESINQTALKREKMINHLLWDSRSIRMKDFILYYQNQYPIQAEER